MANKEQIKKITSKAQQDRLRIQLASQLGELNKNVENLSDEEKLNSINIMRSNAASEVPRNSEELWNYIRVVYGKAIPYTSTDPDFQAPFHYFNTLWFGKHEDIVALASRGGGKTDLASIYLDMCGNLRPLHEVVHAAGTKVQASVLADYTDNFYNDPVLKPYFSSAPPRESAKWKNGAKYKITTGSMKGVSGQHSNVITLDEIEFWRVEDLQQTFEVPVTKNGYKRGWAAFSTRQRAWGGMSWLVDEAPKRNIKVFQWSAFETMQPCRTCLAIDAHPNYRGEATDKAREDVCILWKHCRGERAKKATGWLPLEEIQNKCTRLGGPDGREWLTQGMCSRPSSHGLVLFNFEHEYRPDGNYTKWTYQPELPWYATHDPAEGKKSVIYFIQVQDGKSFVFDERILHECPDVTAAKQDFYEYCMLKGYGDPDVIVVDPHRTDAVATWKFGTPDGVGIARKYSADVPDTTETTGSGQLLYKTLDNLREYICNGKGERKLLVNPEYCAGCIKGVKEHHYPTDMNNNILSNKPNDAYKDEIDPLRYWVMYLRTKFGKHTGRLYIL